MLTTKTQLLSLLIVSVLISGCHNLIVSAFQKPAKFEVLYGNSFDEVFTGTKIEKLARAVYDKNLREVKLLLENGISPNLVGKGGVTPLMLALRLRDRKIFEYLLVNGADPNLVQENGESVMFASAGLYVSSFFLDMALRYGGNPKCYNPIKNKYCIHQTTSMNMNERQSLLVEAGSDLNVQNGLGDTPLLESIILHNLELSYLFLKNGANPLIEDNFGNSFLTLLEEYKSGDKKTAYWKNKVLQLLQDSWGIGEFKVQ